MLPLFQGVFLPSSLYHPRTRDEHLAASGLLGRLSGSQSYANLTTRCSAAHYSPAIPATPASSRKTGTLGEQSMSLAPPPCVYSPAEKEPLGDVLKRAGKRCDVCLCLLPPACVWGRMRHVNHTAEQISHHLQMTTRTRSPPGCSLDAIFSHEISETGAGRGMQGSGWRYSWGVRHGRPGFVAHVAQNHSQLPVRAVSPAVISMECPQLCDLPPITTS